MPRAAASIANFITRAAHGVGCCGLLLFACGCGARTIGLQPGWAKNRLRMDDVSIAGVQGPEERGLRNRLQRDQYEASSEQLAAEFQALEQAQQLYDAGKYAEAEQQFELVRERVEAPSGLKKRFFNRHQFSDDLYQSPIEEDALFMIAQSQFQQGRLADAEQSYAALLKQYPSTRHLDDTSRQLFRIAREWLGFPDERDAELVQVAYNEQAPPSLEQRSQARSSILPNVRDTSRPTYNADGKGLDALRLIWLHDAAGPLADDALMMAANYHLRTGNHIEAAQHYRLLREQFPDSPHLKDSLMLGSHVLLASYNGPGYDPSPLEEAKQLKLMSLQYPDLAAEDRERLEQELANLAEAEVEPLWKEVQFYLAKRQTESVLLHCNYIVNTYPNSKYARMAMDVREKITGQPATARADNWATLPSQAIPNPPPATPPAQAADAPVDMTAPATGGFGSRIPRPSFGGLLRRAEEAPDLQPVEEPDQPAEPAQPAPESGRVRLQSW
ncbi:MAG: tetratricopeptide repeat protein [Planctomycetaceae bacterium]